MIAPPLWLIFYNLSQVRKEVNGSELEYSTLDDANLLEKWKLPYDIATLNYPHAKNCVFIYAGIHLHTISVHHYWSASTRQSAIIIIHRSLRILKRVLWIRRPLWLWTLVLFPLNAHNTILVLFQLYKRLFINDSSHIGISDQSHMWETWRSILQRRF